MDLYRLATPAPAVNVANKNGDDGDDNDDKKNNNDNDDVVDESVDTALRVLDLPRCAAEDVCIIEWPCRYLVQLLFSTPTRFLSPSFSLLLLLLLFLCTREAADAPPRAYVSSNDRAGTQCNCSHMTPCRVVFVIVVLFLLRYVVQL
jgi:hypothetical protein